MLTKLTAGFTLEQEQEHFNRIDVENKIKIENHYEEGQQYLIQEPFRNPSEMIDASNADVNQLFQKLIVKEGGNYRCTVCEKSMVNKSNLEYHVETHMTGLSYECKHCGETFRSRNVLKHHRNNTHK